MDESRASDVEFIAAELAESAFAMVPLLAPLGKAFTVSLAVADRRRNELILSQLAEALEALGLRIEKLAENPEFLAALTLAVRSSQTTSNEDKHRLLRQALVGIAAGDRPTLSTHEHFLRLLDGYDPEHIRALQFAADHEEAGQAKEDSGRVNLLRFIADAVFGGDGVAEITAARVLRELTEDGLLDIESSVTWDMMSSGSMQRPERVSALGLEFLTFVREPKNGTPT